MKPLSAVAGKEPEMNTLRSIARAAALSLGLAVSMAGAGAQTLGASGGVNAPLNADFNPSWWSDASFDLAPFDLDSMWQGASLLLSGPATLSFSFVGGEASYNNAFLLGDQRIDSLGDGGLALGESFTYAQASAGTVDFGFLSNGWGTLFAGTSLRVGLLLAADQRSALLVFNDAFRGDTDFDDMVIHVAITPVPEPETLLMWAAGLVGLGGWLRRRGKRQHGSGQALAV
jgi:hypothetical protein